MTWVPGITGDRVQERSREWFGVAETTHDTFNTLIPSVQPVMSQARTPLWGAQPVRLEEGPRQESVRACQDPDGCWPETEVRRWVWVVLAFLDMKPMTSRGASYHPVANNITECDEGLPEPEGCSSSTPVHPSPCNRTCADSLRCFRKATGSPST